MRKMRSHTADITPKLRSVLFLIDGVQTLEKILERAGALRPLLESQLEELYRRGLVEVAGSAGNSRPEPPQASNAGAVDTASDVPPIIGAKMQLLRQLERLEGHEVRQYSAALVEARCWRELASRTKELSQTLHGVAGADAASKFWKSAKEILVAWRGKEVSLNQP